MKRFNFLTGVVAVLITITAVSCTTMRDVSDENYERSRAIGDRVYVDDPYRGTVILERDPYTGRYYDITNSFIGARYGRYSPYFNTFDNRGYNTYYNNRNYRNNIPQRNVQQPTREEKAKEIQQNRNDARKRILGGGN